MSEVKIACKNCAGHIEFPGRMIGEIIPCPHCGLSVVLKLDVSEAKIKNASEFIGIGCFVQAIGVVLLIGTFWFLPAAIIGLLLIIIGGRMAIKYKCGHCGNYVPSKSVKICAACQCVLK